METKTNKVALAIQGGGVRGAFASGVLDVFLEEGLTFPYIIGVSAGVLNACNFVSKDFGRSYIVCSKYMQDKRFYGRKVFLKTHSYFNFDFLFNELAKSELPFDYQTFANSPTEIVAVATRCKDAKPAYFYKSKMPMDEFLNLACAASASLPLLSKKVVIDDEEYLDGGIVTPLPLEKVKEDGYEKVLVILSRPIGFRKTKSHRNVLISKMPTFSGTTYRFLRKALRDTYLSYNECIDKIENSSDKKNIYIIAPKETYDIKVTEQDTTKIERLYLDGKEIAKKEMEAIKKFLYE